MGNDFPFVVNEIVRDQPQQLTVHRSCVARWVSSQKDKGDGGCSSRTPLNCLPRSWDSGEVHAEWQLVSVIPVYKAMKDDPGNYRPLSLTSVPEKVLGKTILGAAERHLKDNAVIRHSQHRVTGGSPV